MNIRGLYTLEAIKKVENYIDQLYLNSKKQGRIVHGKGQGILKESVHNLLKSCPYVKSFMLAPSHLGGHGVTIIYMIEKLY